MLDQLNIDIINLIIHYLNDKDTAQLLSTCQHIYAMRSHLIYKFLIQRDKVIELPYADQFVHLAIDTDMVVSDYSKIYRITNYTGLMSLNCFTALRELNMENYVCDVLPTLPPRLKLLKLPNTYNGSLLNILPSTLSKLHLGIRYNQPLYEQGKKILRYGLKCIIFSHCFNQEVISPHGQRYLPPTLIQITFGHNFNQPIFCNKHSVFSKNLVKLKFGRKFDQPIISPEGLPYIPTYVKELELNFSAHVPLGLMIGNKKYSALPYGLNTLKLLQLSHTNIAFIPSKLKLLTIFRINNMISISSLSQLNELRIQKVSVLYEFEKDDFPQNLQRLYINYYNKCIPASVLPDGLQILELGELYERLLDPDLKVNKIILHNNKYIGNIPSQLLSKVVIL
jgi:hypothetical protein